MFIQKALISILLSPLNTLMKKLPQKLRDAMFITGGAGLAVHFFMYLSRIASYRFLYFFVISCVFLGLVILGSLGGDIKPVRFRKILFLPMAATGLFMVVSSFINNVDYLPDAMLLLVAFPILYICWGNADRTHLTRLLLKVNKYALVLFILLSFLFTKITPRQYCGFSGNQNATAYFLSTAVVMVVCDIMYQRKFTVKTAFDILLSGIAFALIYYTNSRSGMLAVIFSLSLGTVVFLVSHSKKEILSFAVKFGATALCAAICAGTLLYVFQLRQWLPIPYYSVFDKDFDMDERWEELFSPKPDTPDLPDTPDQPDTPDSPDSPDQPDSPDNDGSGQFFDGSGFSDINKDKLDTTDKTADNFSTGRISVWKAYAKDLNLFGHESTPEVYIPIIYKDIKSTHMTILQIAYESGIFAGVSYLVLNIASGILAIIYAVRHRSEIYALLPLLVIAAFGVLSMLMSCRVTFWYYSTLMYYFALAPLMVRDVKAPSEK